MGEGDYQMVERNEMAREEIDQTLADISPPGIAVTFAAMPDSGARMESW